MNTEPKIDDFSEPLMPFPKGVCVLPDDLRTVKQRMMQHRIPLDARPTSPADMALVCGSVYLAVERSGHHQPAWRIMNLWADWRGLEKEELPVVKLALEMLYASRHSYEQEELSAEQIIALLGARYG